MKKQILSYLSLGQICDVQSGGTPSRHINAYWEKGNIPWVKISDIKGKHLLGTDEYITRQGLENSSAKIFPKGTILYTIFATLGETTILNIDAATNQAIAGINIHDQYKKIILTDYLYYYLLSIKDIMCKVGRGVAQNNLNLKILRNVQVPVPTIEEQKKIIDTLSSIEKIMLVKDRQLSLLSNLVKSRFLELFGDPNDVSILSLPGEKKSIEDVCDGIYGGGTPSKSHKEYYTGKIPWVTPKDMKTLSIDDSQNHINSEAIENSTAKLIPKRCVLMVIRSGILKHLLMCDKEAIEVQKILPFLSDTWPLCRIGRAVIRASQSCRQSCNKSQCPACGCRSRHSCTHARRFSQSFPARGWGSIPQRQGACGQSP